MNYIGSKLSLLDFLEQSIFTICPKSANTFCDLFAGTGIVGQHFKKIGLSVISNDLQYYSYCLNKHYIENNHPITFNNLHQIGINDVFGFLNALTPYPGFIYKNYSFGGTGERLYFSDTNAMMCDTIRQQVESWHTNKLINDYEYFFLITSLLESIDKYANTASVYGAYLKKLKLSANKKMILVPAKIITGTKKNYVYNQDANELIRSISCDILYLDPPYNERQYASNYHLLETIAKYDKPKISGKTGLRDYSMQKSQFCRKNQVCEAFKDIIENAKAKYIFVSYNNEGLMSLEQIRNIMSIRGEYGYFTKDYNRFKSDNTRDYSANKTTEYIHWVKCKK